MDPFVLPKNVNAWIRDTGLVHVLLSTSNSDIARTAGIISNYFGANNNYGFGQPILNIYKPVAKKIVGLAIEFV